MVRELSFGRFPHLLARGLIVHERLYFDALSRLYASLVPRTSWLTLIECVWSSALSVRNDSLVPSEPEPGAKVDHQPRRFTCARFESVSVGMAII